LQERDQIAHNVEFGVWLKEL